MSLNICNFVAWAENEIRRTDDSSGRTFYEHLTFRVSGKFLYSLLPLSMHFFLLSLLKISFFLLSLLKLQPCYQTLLQLWRRSLGVLVAGGADSPPRKARMRHPADRHRHRASEIIDFRKLSVPWWEMTPWTAIHWAASTLIFLHWSASRYKRCLLATPFSCVVTHSLYTW